MGIDYGLNFDLKYRYAVSFNYRQNVQNTGTYTTLNGTISLVQILRINEEDISYYKFRQRKLKIKKILINET